MTLLAPFVSLKLWATWVFVHGIDRELPRHRLWAYWHWLRVGEMGAPPPQVQSYKRKRSDALNEPFTQVNPTLNGPWTLVNPKYMYI